MVAATTLVRSVVLLLRPLVISTIPIAAALVLTPIEPVLIAIEPRRTIVVPTIRAAVWTPVRLAIEIRTPVQIVVRPAVRASPEVRLRIGTAIEVGAWTPGAVEIRAAIGPDEGRTVVNRIAAPAIALAVEVAVAIIAIPVVADTEDNGRNPQRAIIFRSDIDATFLVERLHVASGNPAAPAVELDVTPWNVRKAPVDLNRFAGGNDGNGRILRARPGPHVDVGRRKAVPRFSNRRSQQKCGCGGDFHQSGFHALTPADTANPGCIETFGTGLYPLGDKCRAAAANHLTTSFTFVFQ